MAKASLTVSMHEKEEYDTDDEDEEYEEEYVDDEDEDEAEDVDEDEDKEEDDVSPLRLSLGIRAPVKREQEDEDESNIYLKVSKTVPFKVKKSDTVADLKAKFQSKEGSAARLQKLFFAGNLLKDDRLLAEYNIPNSSTLDMQVTSEPSMQISVEIPIGRKVMLNVENSDTIQIIKAMIRAMESISPDRQMALVFGGRALEDTHTLSDYDITTNSTLYMVLQDNDKAKVMISDNFSEEKFIELDVRTSYTVWDLKTMIKSLKQVEQEEQKLFLHGKELKNFVTLAAYNIRSHSFLDLSYPMKVFILYSKTNRGDSVKISLTVYGSDKVSALQTRIQEILDVPVCDQRLLSDARRLQYDQKIGDQDLEDGCTIFLISAPKGPCTECKSAFGKKTNH